MLNQRQQAILQFIYQYVAAHGFTPSVREIGAAVGIRSSSATSYQMERLTRLGYLVKTRTKSRSAVLTRAAYDLLSEGDGEAEVERLRAEIRFLRSENERLRLAFQA